MTSDSPTQGERSDDLTSTRSAIVHVLVRAARLGADVGVLLAGFMLAYLLRFDFVVPKSVLAAAYLQAPFVVSLQFIALRSVGARSLIWRYIGMTGITSFIKAGAASAAVIGLIRLAFPSPDGWWHVPVSVVVMSTVFGFGGALGLRVMRRAVQERHDRRDQLEPTHDGESATRRVLLIGAGSAGVTLAKEIQADSRMNLELRGFIDDDPRLQRGTIQGVRVLGTTRDLPRLVPELGIDHVVIAIVADEPGGVGLSRRDVRRIREICDGIPVKVRIIPSMNELLSGRLSVSRIRDIRVDDLLGREPVLLEPGAINGLVQGATVAVTGAGGSIGSELARQVARCGPARLLLIERSEPAMFTIEQELRSTFPDLCLCPLVGDVGDMARMQFMFREYGPQVVLHAAAHKHVPLMESNVVEAVSNNVLATRSLAQLAGESGVGVFVLVSTDKAVRPTSVMGASKRMAEIVVQGLDARYETRYVAVRFGNVMGSTGSAIPIFQEQIRKGQPVTVTHPDMMRYFMTIPEAAQLVLQAAAIGEGGEIFILDMGEPLSVLGIAEDVIRLSGLRPYEDIDIVFTGLRPGEKLVEELDTRDEQVVRTRHPKILIGNIQVYPEDSVRDALKRLTELRTRGSGKELRYFLQQFLTEANLGCDVDDAPTAHSVAGVPDGPSRQPVFSRAESAS